MSDIFRFDPVAECIGTENYVGNMEQCSDGEYVESLPITIGTRAITELSKSYINKYRRYPSTLFPCLHPIHMP